MQKEKIVAAIDLKAFYAYVECVDRNLDPWKTPLVVCDKERGKNTIILSVSPYLKKKGVPSRLRIRDLPKGFDYVYAVPRMERYIQRSSEVVSIFLDFISEEDLHVYSIDESFLDLTSYLDYYKMTPIELVKHIKNTIKEKTGLETTAGIGNNLFLSKVALDIYAKKEKDGIATIFKKDIKTKLWPITPLNKIWGIGERMEKRLNKLNIFDVKDLATADMTYMMKHFGIIGEQLVNHANGIDDSDIRVKYIPNDTSLTVGQVLFKDYSINEIPLIIREMCDDLCLRLRLEKKLTKVVSLMIGYSKEGGFMRQMSLLMPSDNGDYLFGALMEIFNKFVLDRPIRRVSLVFSSLIPLPNYEQLSLFEELNTNREDRSLEKTIDKIKQRYGMNCILRASALTENSTAIERHNQIGGHRK